MRWSRFAALRRNPWPVAHVFSGRHVFPFSQNSTLGSLTARAVQTPAGEYLPPSAHRFFVLELDCRQYFRGPFVERAADSQQAFDTGEISSPLDGADLRDAKSG